MPCPSPLPGISDLFEELGQFVRQPSANENFRNRSRSNAGHTPANDSNILYGNVNFGVNPPVTRRLFSGTKNFSHIFRSLQSVQNAKSFIYSSSFFGEKKFYADDFDFNKAPVHPENRRKIRFGLKSILDFVVQLDLHSLRGVLLESDNIVENFNTRQNVAHLVPLNDDSFANLLRMANPRKFKRMFAILERLISNLHCAQSMNEYFASENAIEAAKLVMSEAIKKGPDFGNFLLGGSFASCV